jgi:predicted dehydrogenase
MTNQLGVAILGCGYWGINYVRVFSELPGSQVLAVCDERPDRLQEVGRRFPGVHLTTQIEDALSLDGVSAAVVCTPATTHFSVSQHALLAGKHLLIEKPITRTVAEAKELAALADYQGLILMVGHTFLYNPALRKVKEYVDRPEVGRVYYLYSSRTNLGPIRRDVNALWDLAPHDVAIFNYLLGEVPEWVSAVGAKVLRNCREDVGFITLGYRNNVVGHIHVSWADPNKVREVVVVGSEKRIVFNDLNGVEQVRVFDKGVMAVASEPSSFGEYQFQIRDGDIFSPKIEFSEPLKNQCRHFLECVVQDIRPLTSSLEGLEVVQVLEAIDRSIERKGTPVEVERNGHCVRQQRAAAGSLR